jgi:hypothetical protein
MPYKTWICLVGIVGVTVGFGVIFVSAGRKQSKKRLARSRWKAFAEAATRN